MHTIQARTSCIHTHAHAYTHTTHIHTRMLTYTTHTYTRIYTYTCTQKHTHKHTVTQRHPHVHTHMYVNICRHMHAYTHTLLQTELRGSAHIIPVWTHPGEPTQVSLLWNRPEHFEAGPSLTGRDTRAARIKGKVIK